MRLNKTLKNIVDGIQDKKGRNVRVVDLRKIDDTICDFIVICEGNTPTQVSAISDSVENKMRTEMGVKALSIAGKNNNLWVAMDFADIVVHVFVPDFRQFYDIDNLWEDAKFEDIPDLD